MWNKFVEFGHAAVIDDVKYKVEDVVKSDKLFARKVRNETVREKFKKIVGFNYFYEENEKCDDFNISYYYVNLKQSMILFIINLVFAAVIII